MTAERIRKVAELVVKQQLEGYQVAVVVSAMGHSTDELIALAQSVHSQPNLRELDMVMSTGEQLSAGLTALAIQALGCRAISLTGSQAGIATESEFGCARIENIDTCRVEEILSNGVIPVIAGFQGITSSGDITTLGRGGSDTTAIALAAAIHAQRCDIYSDVTGVFSADPRVVPDAQKFDQISPEQMLELANNGAQVLAARSVDIAIERCVPVRVRSTFAPDDVGTLVSKSVKNWEQVGVARDTSLACLSVYGAFGELDCKSKLKGKIERGIPRDWRHILTSQLIEYGVEFETGLRDGNPNRLTLAVSRNSARTTACLIDELVRAFGVLRVKIDQDVAKVSAIGEAMWCQKDHLVKALNEAQIPVQLVVRKDKRLSFFVQSVRGAEATATLHQALYGKKLAAQTA